MKALSIKQPWANLIADGRKGIEVRTWATTYEGIIMIHASKSVDSEAVPFFRGVSTQPRGALIAKAYLTMCVPYTKEEFIIDKENHLMPLLWYDKGLFGWLLVNVEKLDRPVPYSGQLGLFEVKL